MSEIRDKAAEEYAYSNGNYLPSDGVGFVVRTYAFKAGYDYAKRNDPDIKALVEALEIIAEPLRLDQSIIGRPMENMSTANLALHNYRKAIEGEK